MKTNNTKFLESLKSDTPEKSEGMKWLDEQISLHVKEKGFIEPVEGIYGDSNVGCMAYAKEVIKPESGGTFYELYGCSYKYQGGLNREITDRVATVKRALFEVVKLIFKNPIIFLTLRLAYIENSIKEIYIADLEKWQLPDKEFSRAMRELIRVGLKWAGESKTRRRIVYCLAMIFEFDNAYFQRLRDILCLFSKAWLQINVRAEINRVFSIAINRENDGPELLFKLEMARKFLSVGLLFSKQLRDFVSDFICELDLEKIDFDGDDWFFCLNRRGYNFRGMSFADRYKEYQRINKEKGHIIIGNE